MAGLKARDFQKPLQGGLPALGIGVNQHSKVRVSLVGKVFALLVLCLPVFCEAGPVPEGQQASKEFNLNSGGAVLACVRVFDFLDQPVADWWAGFVEVVPAVSPQIEAKTSPKAQQKTDEVKKDDAVRYGFGDLIKDHGLVLLISFLLGFMGFAFAGTRKYSD